MAAAQAPVPRTGGEEWKHWWAVTEADRLRLRVEIDALCADLYGLEPDDFDWIVRDDPTDPKGFYRVDESCRSGNGLPAWLPPPSVVEGGQMVRRIRRQALQRRVLRDHRHPRTDQPGQEACLIRKRNGCHGWKPEEFGKDDPRHGWTWEDCWNDAVALLGSEEAVQKYIEGDSKTDAEAEDDPAAEQTGPKDLFGTDAGETETTKDVLSWNHTGFSSERPKEVVMAVVVEYLLIVQKADTFCETAEAFTAAQN